MAEYVSRDDPRFQYRLEQLHRMNVRHLVAECNRCVPNLFAHEKMAVHVLIAAILASEGFTD